jgi:hypothetical protein
VALDKTILTPPLDLQTVATGGIVKAEVDVAAAVEVSFLIRLGRKATTALTGNVRVWIGGSHASSGDAAWVPIGADFLMDVATAEAEAVSGTVSAGATIITLASTTNLTEGEWVFILNATLALSEWGRIRKVTTNTSIELVDALVNAQTGSTVYDLAAVWQVSVPEALGYERLRVVVSNASGVDVAVEVRATVAEEV